MSTESAMRQKHGLSMKLPPRCAIRENYPARKGAFGLRWRAAAQPDGQDGGVSVLAGELHLLRA
jgi:hypothetical protein